MVYKVHVVRSDNYVAFENAINSFIKNKILIDIKYQPTAIVTESYPNGMPKTTSFHDSALIVYRDLEDKDDG